MQQRYDRIRPPSNPILQVFALIGAVVFAVGAIFIGAIFLSFFLGLAVIAGLVLYIRLWWLRRKARTAPPRGQRRTGDYVEVEYTVVRERSESNSSSKSNED